MWTVEKQQGLTDTCSPTTSLTFDLKVVAEFKVSQAAVTNSSKA